MKKSILLLFFLILIARLTTSAQSNVDTIPPTITLIGADTLKWEVLIPFKDPGVKLKDDSTSDSALLKGLIIKSNVNINKTDTYQIQYDVKDLAGNAAKTKIRTVMVVDTVKPVITLIGNQAQQICRGRIYTDPGYTLSDNYDKKNQIKVTTSGTFKDTKLDGLYTLIYQATDSHNNIGYSKTRYILVEPSTTDECKVGINDQSNNNINQPNIFPNPANNLLTLEFEQNQSNAIQIYISDITGRQVRGFINASMNYKTFQIPTSNIPNGIYFLNVQSRMGNVIQKIEIRH